MEEVYEELPGEQEIYEDLPGADFDPYPNSYPYPGPSPTSNTPPPLPTGPIPHRPDKAPPLPTSPIPQIPTRAPTTSLSSQTRTLPPPKKNTKQEKSSTMGRRGPSPVAKTSAGGIDMGEILKRARQRSERAIEDLERSKQQKDDDDDRHTAPWLNQLRKTNPSPKLNEDVPPPWVRRRSRSEFDRSNNDDDVPEFIKKARSLMRQGSDESPPSSSPNPSPKPPPLAAKPHVPPPQTQEEKPAWARQRERQHSLSRMSRDESVNKLPPPAHKPVVPPPLSPKPVQQDEGERPPLARKPRPIPTPRVSPKPASIPPPLVPPHSIPPPLVPPHSRQPPEPQPEEEEVSPVTPSIRERARTLQQNLGGGLPQETPPSPKVPPPSPKVPPPSSKAPPPSPKVSPPRPKIKPPLPLPVEPPESEERPPPPLPRQSSRTNVISLPPSIPTREREAPIPETSPPPVPMRESSVGSSRPPPSLPTSPPLHLPVSQGEPTPPAPMVSLKFRRRPLQSVDLRHPPLIPSRSLKPRGLAASEDDGPDEIYDDTLGATGGAIVENGQIEPTDSGPEELYDDVSINRPPLPSYPPPSTRPPFTYSTEQPPPLPSYPPPIIRPPIKIDVVEELVYEMDDDMNGMSPVPIDEEQEMYEDMNPEDLPHANISHSSSATLFPPSPQHPDLSPSASPTLSRKKQSKDEKKAAKEEERREKERKRIEKEREKERKKKEEIKMKNRLRGIKQYKQFQLPPEVKPLFPVEVLLEHPRTKDHINVSEGEIVSVLLISHPKLPDGKYLIEKEDGTLGYVSQRFTQRTTYQSAQDVFQGVEPVVADYPGSEDLYESLPAEEEPYPSAISPPNLPPPNLRFNYPPPSQPPPPPPEEGPEENYEYLPA